MNSKGFSLIEVLVAIAMISAALYLLMVRDQTYVSRGYNLRRACEAYAESIVSAVQEETYYRNLGVYLPDSTGRQPVTNPFTPTRAVPNANWYWNSANPAYSVSRAGTDTDAPPLHNNLLIQGSLASLFAIYNNVPAVRCAYGAHAPLTANANIPLPSDLRSLPVAPTVELRLEPYDITDGASRCGLTPPLFAAPRGFSGGQNNAERDVFSPNSGLYNSAEDSTAPGDSAAAVNPTATEIARKDLPTNHGMIMSVRLNYTFEGDQQTCVASQRFEYPVDRTPPPTPNRVEVSNNTSIPGGPTVLRDYCVNGLTDPRGGATIEVGYLNQLTEGGTQFLCKDLSWIREPNSTTECRDGSNGLIYATQPNIYYFSGPDFSPDFLARQRSWQPCDLLNQCGMPPVAVNASMTDPSNLFLRLTYQGLPPGCSMNLEVVAVDSAGNRSGVRSDPLSKAFLEPTPEQTTSTPYGADNFTVRDDEIYYPTCGNVANPYYKPQLGNICPGYFGGVFTGYYYKCGNPC